MNPRSGRQGPFNRRGQTKYLDALTFDSRCQSIDSGTQTIDPARKTLNSDVQSVHSAAQTIHFPVQTLHFAVQSLHSDVQSLHFAVQTVHSGVQTFHFAPKNRNPRLEPLSAFVNRHKSSHAAAKSLTKANSSMLESAAIKGSQLLPPA